MDFGTEEPEQKTFEIISLGVYPGGPSGVYDFEFKLKDNINLNQTGAKVEIQKGNSTQTFIVGNGRIDANDLTYSINFGSTLASGEYTITITLPDGKVGTKTFTIS